MAEAVVRCDDDIEAIKQKIRIATIIGTFQATLTNFRYLRPIWRRNCEEERLLGVSLTGIADNVLTSVYVDEDVLSYLKEYSIEVNKEWAAKLKISEAAAITTIKPSGTVSQLVNSSSGIHPRFAPFYIRTIRADNKDPLCGFLKSQGVPHEPDVTKPANTTVFSFPMKSPTGSLMRDDWTAIQQLNHYLKYKQHWTEHNPSITVYVREHEWIEVGAWIWEHFDEIGGISFLPHSDHIYKQAPYQEIDEKVYHELAEAFPTIKWEEFKENEDVTTSSHELACSAGVCEIL